jgi:hypothetical protein
LKTTITYAGQQIEVENLSFITKKKAGVMTANPTASEHPVVKAKGRTVKLLSPVKLAANTTFTMDSGFDNMRYTILVDLCYQVTGGFEVLGTIQR